MKKLLLGLIVATSAANSFAIVGGKSLDSLIGSKPTIANIAKSSIGLEITTTKGQSYCSGFAISPTQIVTAAHCIYDLNNKKPLVTEGSNIKIYTVSSNNDNGAKQTVIPAHAYIPDPANIAKPDGGDIAIITLPGTFKLSNSQTPELLANTLSSKNLTGAYKDQQFLIDTILTGDFMKKQPTIYRIGWGAKQKFEYSNLAMKCSKNQTPFFYEAALNSNVRMLPPENVDNYKTKLTFQLSQKIEGQCNVEYNDDDNKNITNYNLVKQDDNGDSITEGGDSGGATIACLKGAKEQCFVIGTHNNRAVGSTNPSVANSLLSFGSFNLLLKVFAGAAIDNKFVKQLF
jgi:hypothetical protein